MSTHETTKQNVLFPQVTKPNPKGRGRPVIDWDLDQVKIMGFAEVSYSDMAIAFGVNRKTIEREMGKKTGDFVDAYTSGCVGQKISILKHTFKRAMVSDRILEFVLKNKFGWADKIEQTGDTPLVIMHVDKEGNPTNGLPLHLQDLSKRGDEPKEIEEE